MTSWAKSLRGRLWLAGTVGVLLTALLAAWLLGAVFDRAAQRAFDRRLGDDLLTLVGMSEFDENGVLSMSKRPADERYWRVFSGAYWQIVDGNSDFRSRSLWDEGLPLPQVMPKLGDTLFLNVSGPMGQPLRMQVQRLSLPRGAEPVTFIVAGSRQELLEEVGDFRWMVAISVALLAAAFFTVLGYQVGYGLAPLKTLDRTADRLRKGEDARFPETGLPTEVAPLARHLNELLDQHARTVERARATTGDLAHALKTPLAVLAAEIAHPDEISADAVADQVQRIRAHIDRHLATGWIADPRQRTPLAPVVGALCRLMQNLYAERGIRFGEAVGEEVFAGAQEDLEEMLGNLLDNAGKWARGEVRVAARREGDRLRIEILDDGPGLPSEALDAVMQRGVRLDEQVPGSGLGLDIVRQLAASYGGALVLATTPTGLSAMLELPAG